MRHLTRFALVAAMFAGVAVAAPAYATPPSIPSASTAQSELNVLTVAATWFAASDVDIDHVVPLAEAWRRCTYARMWIGVKYYYGLTLQSSEKSALQTMLNSC
jgi:hypothetical protein